MAKAAAKKATSKPAKKTAKVPTKEAKKPAKPVSPAKASGKTAAKAPAKPAAKAVTKPVKAEKPAVKPAKAVEVKASKAAPAKETKAVAPVKESKAPAEKPAKAEKESKAAVSTKFDKSVSLENVFSEGEKLSEDQKKWFEMYKKHRAEASQAYNMREQFVTGKPLEHKILGWGWIVSIENDRLEVLFKDGKRMLISNYKA